MKDFSTPRKTATSDSKARGVDSLAKSSRVDTSLRDKNAIDHVKSLSRKLAEAQALADVRLQEIIGLSKLVVQLKEQIQSQTQPSSSQLNKIRKRRFWSVPSYLSGRMKSNLKGDLSALRNSPFFDQLWYLKKYPDVQESGIDPALHYLKFGANEGRDPGPKFNTSEYLKKNADLINTGVNPLLHYIKKNG